MTREEIIKKIESLFTAKKVSHVVYDSVSGYEYELDKCDEIRQTFLKEFHDEIGQIADMILPAVKVSKGGLVGCKSDLYAFEKGDYVYVEGNDDYWPSINIMPDKYNGEKIIECEAIVCINGEWMIADGVMDVCEGIRCRPATDEEIKIFNDLKNKKWKSITCNI